MGDVEHEMERQRLWDEWHALRLVNVAQLPGETYAQALRRRAELNLRIDEIWKKIAP